MKIRATFYKRDPSTSANTDGQVPESGSEQFTRWVRLVPLRGTERYLAEQSVADVVWVLRTRYDASTSSVTPDWWVKIGDRRLNVSRTYDPDGERREFEMELIERAA